LRNLGNGNVPDKTETDLHTEQSQKALHFTVVCLCLILKVLLADKGYGSIGISSFPQFREGNKG